jgi:hypothetical protein
VHFGLDLESNTEVKKLRESLRNETEGNLKVGVHSRLQSAVGQLPTSKAKGEERQRMAGKDETRLRGPFFARRHSPRYKRSPFSSGGTFGATKKGARCAGKWNAGIYCRLQRAAHRLLARDRKPMPLGRCFPAQGVLASPANGAKWDVCGRRRRSGRTKKPGVATPAMRSIGPPGSVAGCYLRRCTAHARQTRGRRICQADFFPIFFPDSS